MFLNVASATATVPIGYYRKLSSGHLAPATFKVFKSEQLKTTFKNLFPINL